MANTVSLINLSDTFGVWITRTNDIAKENNDLAANNYVKSTGTLFLDAPILGLQVKNNAYVKGGLEAIGPGSYLRVDNNVTANGQVYFTNPNTGLINSGELLSNGKISASGSNIGLAVANNSTMGGYLTIANTLTVGSTLSVTGATTLGNTLTVSKSTTLSNTLSVTENSTFGNNITITNKTTATDFVATNETNTRTLSVRTSGSVLLDLSVERNTFANTLQANTSINTATLFVTGRSFTNTLQANTSINTATISVTGSSFVNNLQANSTINTFTLSVTGNSFVKVLQANTSINTETLSVTGSSFTDILQANTQVNTALLTASSNATIAGRATVGSLTSNTSISTTSFATSSAVIATADIGTSLSSPNITLLSGGKISGNSADIFINNIVAQGRLSVVGDFVINGTTVYNSPAMTLSSTSPNQIGFINVFRTANGQSNGVVANASIRWNESASPIPYWDIKDTSTGTFYRIITEQQVLDTVNSTSSANAASSKAANTLNNSIISLNASLNSNVTSLQSQINSNVTSLQSQITTNVSSLQAQITSNASISQAGIDASYARANNSSNSFTGTTGSVIPSNGSITFSSTNGVTISGTGSTLTVNTPQNLRTTDTPTFNNLNLSSPLPITYGGTGQTTALDARTALLPTGTTAGYVLTTGGPGNFYWGPGGSGGSGGGSTPGTTITSSRLNYSATDGQKVFASPPFTTGTQVRVYINGVRQTSDYTENSTPITGVTIIGTAGQFSCTSATLALNQAIVITGSFGGTGSISGYVTGKTYYIIATNGTTTFTLSESQGGTAVTTVAGTPTGVTYTTGYSITLTNGAYLNDAVLVEVDGFIINPYYANNIAYTVNSTIGATANTIQLAIDGLTSLAAPKADPEFSGIPKVPTATVGTNTTQIASTKFVNDSLNAGTGTTYTHSISGLSGTTSQTNFTNLTIATSQVLSAANYNNYAPTLTGTGASGSWNISAAQVGGLSLQTASAAPSGEQIIRSDTNSRVYLSQINSNTNNDENPTVSQVIVTNGSDNFYRKSSITNLANAVRGVASGTWSISVTGSAANLSANRINYWNVTNNNVVGQLMWKNYQNGHTIFDASANTTPMSTMCHSFNPDVAWANTYPVLMGYNGVNTYGVRVDSSRLADSATISTSCSGSAATFTSTTQNSQFNSIGVGTAASTVAGEIRASGSITAYYSSDKKFKQNIETIPSALDKVSAIGGKTFDWTEEYLLAHGGEDDYFLPKSDFGVIAQDVQSVFPQAVRTREDGSLAVDYAKLSALAFAAIVELKAEIDDLKGKIK